MPCWHLPADCGRLQGANVYFLDCYFVILVPSGMLDARFFVAKFLLVIIISLFLLVTRAIHVQGYSAIEIF